MSKQDVEPIIDSRGQTPKMRRKALAPDMEGKTMVLSICNRRKHFIAVVPCIIMSIILFIAFSCDLSHAAKQKTFGSPEEAVKAMLDAVKTNSSSELLAIFGPAGEELIYSGDESQDREKRERFAKAYEAKNRLERIGEKRVILHVGIDDWPMPVPIVKVGKMWQFKTEEGKREILARRIGKNELGAIQVCLAYVDAQREYAEGRGKNQLAEYAQRFASEQGKKDGLCWEAQEGSPPSPMGPQIANACKETFVGSNSGEGPVPYQGYFYKILKGQGRNAPGGAYDYVIDGRMIGGFALVAYPARHGVSGIMTFIVNQDGVVYQKDFGKKTEKIAEAMALFDPDKTWQKVE